MAPIPAYFDTTRIPTFTAPKLTMSNLNTKTTASSFTPYKIGSGSNAVSVSLCAGPANDASISTKGTALRYMLSTMKPHVALFSLPDLAAPLHILLPTPIDAAEIEAMSFGNQLRSALIMPGNATMMQGLSFHNGKGEIVSADMTVADRKGGILAMKYVHVSSTVKLNSLDTRFNPTEEVTATFYLALPQNLPTGATPAQLFLDGTPRRNATGVTTNNVTVPIPRSMTKAVATIFAADETTYTGTMEFLEDHDTFTSVFTSNPTIYKQGKKDFTPVQAREQFLSEIRPVVWKIFSDILWLDYVGTDPSVGITPAVTARSLRAIRCIMWNPVLRKSTFLTPDEVMTQYLELIPLLTPHDPSEWGFHLFTLYFDSLTQEVGEMLEDTRGRYYFAPPNLATIMTVNSQMRHLREVRQMASLAHGFLSAQDARFRKINNRSLSGGQHAKGDPSTAYVGTGSEPSQPTNATAPAASAFVSPAESTILRYQPASTEYPTDPTNQFTSKYLRGFRGCFGCGSEDHRFGGCPQRQEAAVKSAFHKNYLAHFPDRRKRNDDGSELPTTSDKVPRLYVAVGVSFVANSQLESRPMPIQVNNNLPTADFRLMTADMEPCIDLGCLIDTCAGLNSGNLAFHTHIRNTYPHCVVSFEQFDDENPFRPVKLGGAITSNFDEADHGRLTAVITYRTDIVNRLTGELMTIKFALGADVSVNSLFGAPTLRDLEAIVDIGKSILHLRRVQRSIPMRWSEPRQGVTVTPTATRQAHVRFASPVVNTPAAMATTSIYELHVMTARGIDNRPAWMSSASHSILPLPPIIPANTPIMAPSTPASLSNQHIEANEDETRPNSPAAIVILPPGSPRISEVPPPVSADIPAPLTTTSPITTTAVTYRTEYQTAPLPKMGADSSAALCMLSDSNPGWDFY